MNLNHLNPNLLYFFTSVNCNWTAKIAGYFYLPYSLCSPGIGVT